MPTRVAKISMPHLTIKGIVLHPIVESHQRWTRVFMTMCHLIHNLLKGGASLRAKASVKRRGRKSQK